MLLRTCLPLCVLVMTAWPIVAEDAAKPNGNWRFQFQADSPVTVLLAITEEQGKYFADIVETNPALAGPQKQPVKLAAKNFVYKDGNLSFAIQLNGTEAMNFAGRLAKDGKKISGSLVELAGTMTVIDLIPTKLKKLSDEFELAREDFANAEAGGSLFTFGFVLVNSAAAKKLKLDEARGVADKMTKAAGQYGLRWEQSVALKLASSFVEQDGFAEIGLAQAQRAERMLGENAAVSEQIEVLQVVAKALSKAGKADDAKKMSTTVAKLEARDALDYAKTSVPFDVTPYPGRKGKSDRVTLVEFFTSSEDASCLTPTSACEALLKAYKPGDVVVLEYHVPAVGPDPLMNSDNFARQLGLFGRMGAPVILVNGKPLGRAAGTGDAKERFKQLTDAVNDQLELEAPLKLSLSVAKDPKGYLAKAKVSDVAKPGEASTLRFALVEPTVRYVGGSGVRYHTNVVRAIPGSVKGFAVTKKELEQAVTFNPDDLKLELGKFLEDFAKEQGPFAKPDRPLALKNLKLVAFVQNDETKEILSATQVEVEPK